jgi:leucyl-tRNA synthetase
MTHKTLKKVTEDIDEFKWNTVISSLMEFNNYGQARDTAWSEPAWDEAIDMLLLMMAPAMPHIAESCGRRARTGAFSAEKSIHVTMARVRP